MFSRTQSRPRLALALLPLLLAACGGGDDFPVVTKAQADQAEAYARSLIQTGPCASDNQCGFVTFQSPVYDCSQGSYAPYLLASATAAALLSAAEEQRRLALQARAREPQPGFGCAGVVEPSLLPACTQSQCTLKFGPFPVAPV
jgi:hypothetical protein